MGCCSLSMLEVHQIAFLTMKGWTLVGDEWTKDGFEHAYETHPYGCGCCTKTEKTPYFPLEDAYNAQWERDNG